MSPIISGVVTAVAIAALGFALLNLHVGWQRNRVRRRLVASPSPSSSQSWVLNRARTQLSTHNFTVLLVVAAVVAAMMGMVVDGIGFAAVAAFVVVSVVAALRTHLRRQRLRKYNRQLLRVLDAIVLSLRSGAGLIGGIREAANAYDGIVERDLREVVRQLDMGVGFDDALRVWMQRCPLRSVQLTVACISLAYETGGSSAQSIGAVRSTIRNALAAEASAQAHAAQARASATMLAGLPFVISGPMLVFNETARAFMLHTPVGLGILMTALALDVIGIWWMSTLIARAQA